MAGKDKSSDIEALRQQMIKERDEKAAKAVTPEQKEAVAKLFTVEERLKRRRDHLTTRIVLHDDLGDFEIPIKARPSQKTLYELADSFEIAYKKQNVNPEEYEKAIDRMCRALADISVLPTMTYEWWKNGEDYGPDLILKIFEKLPGEIQSDLDAVKNSRAPRGAAPSGNSA